MVEYVTLEERRANGFYRMIATVSGGIILLTLVFSLIEAVRQYATVGEVTIGEWLVSFDFPVPYVAKPVTYLSISIVVFWFSWTTMHRGGIARISKFSRSILTVFALTVAFVSFYELMYNFTVWGALITADALHGLLRIDLLNIAYPNPKIPWNLVFATKMFASLSTISLYSFYLLLKSSE